MFLTLFIRTQSMWICLSQAGIYLDTAIVLAKQLNVCHVARGSGVNSFFQVQPQILNWIEIWALTWSLQNIHFVVLEPFMCSFCCMYVCMYVLLLLSCWKKNPPNCNSLADWIRLSSRIWRYLSFFFTFANQIILTMIPFLKATTTTTSTTSKGVEYFLSAL